MNEVQKIKRLNDAVLGRDASGNGKCRLSIAMGNPEVENSSIPETDCGICELRKTETSEFVLYQCVFDESNTEGLRLCFDMMKRYADVCEVSNGEPDENHMLFIVFEDDSPDSKGYLVATMPSYFSLTLDSMNTAVPNTYLFVFRKENTAATFAPEEYDEEELEDDDSGFAPATSYVSTVETEPAPWELPE